MKNLPFFLIMLIALVYSCSSDTPKQIIDDNPLLQKELAKEMQIIRIEDTYTQIRDVHGDMIRPGYYVRYKAKPLERIELAGHTESYIQLKSGNMSAKIKWIKTKGLTVLTNLPIKNFGTIISCEVLCLEGVEFIIYRKPYPLFTVEKTTAR